MLRLLLVSLATSAPNLAQADVEPARFALHAELRPLRSSADGRYALDAQARYTPAATSADSRYGLKSTNADCGTLPDMLFANGFE